METKRSWSGMVCLLGVLIVLNSMAAAAEYGGGTGDPNNPYQIWNAEQLNTIGLNSADWDKSFILMADIDMIAYTGMQYNIIGNSSTKFTGTFDGNSHVIQNLTYTTTMAVDSVGLFGYSSGTIQNLGVENISISSGGSRVGGLLGVNFFGTISNCHATGFVNGSRYYVGGLAGSNFHATILICYASGSVGGSSEVGGLVGYNEAGPITACYSTGAVVSSSSYAGGLLGYNNSGDITRCYATGAVSSAKSYIGGLVGKNLFGTISTCYATGLVGGTNAVGGLVGGTEKGTINNSFWDTETSGQTISAGGTGLTTTEMKTLLTFTSAGWDFVNGTDDDLDHIWFIREGLEYPRFVWENQGPIANAGADQTVYAWIDGVADVTLDGSASYDADGDPLTYIWSWTINGTVYDANSINPAIELPAGQHVISLVVNDGITDSNSCDVVITVIEPVKADLLVVPQMLNSRGRLPNIMTIMRLPKGITKEQIDTVQPLLLYPGQIKVDSLWISKYYEHKCKAWKTMITASFDADEFLDAIDETGRIEVAVVGQLKTGQYFYGSDKITIINWRPRPWHRWWFDHRWNRSHWR